MNLPPHLARWASEFATASALQSVDPLLLAAICDRESGGGKFLKPPGPSGTGDNGHGHGLMQIDDRTWAAWLAGHDWTDPTTNINFGAGILKANLVRFAGEFDPEFLAAAAYNCGPGNVRAALAHLPAGATDDQKRAAVDARTAGRNYASDVLARRDAMR